MRLFVCFLFIFSTATYAQQRIVSLSPHLTELTYAVGSGDQLVGVTRYSDYPKEASKLPIVGDAFSLQLEAIAKLKPTLILLWQSGTPERQRAAVKILAEHIKATVYENEIRTVADISKTLIEIGDLTNRKSNALKASQDLTSRWSYLEKKYGANNHNLRVFYQVWPQPLMTFNGTHLVSQAIQLCGGMQGFDNEKSLTPIVSREAVLTFNPQVILSGDAPALKPWKAFKHIEAVQKNQLIQVDSIALTRMSARFLDATEDLCLKLATVNRL